MSASNDTAVKLDGELNDDLVRQYLKNNSDFLQRNPEMLDHLHISHASGSAVSLVEKQVGVLRERNIDMRRRLSTLTANARDNDKLYENTRVLIIKLLEASSIKELHNAFIDAMRDDFKVEHASMILFLEEPQEKDSYRVESLKDAEKDIGPLLKSGKAICGALRKNELSYLFPQAGDIGSAAVMPLDASEQLGLLAVGSSDAAHYNTAMGTLFLTHIAEVIVRILPRLQGEQD